MAQQVIPVLQEADIDKPLDHAYQLFESVMSSLQTQLQEKKEEQIEQTSVLLRNQLTTFFEAQRVLKEHFEESNVTEEVLISWVTYYSQLFQKLRNTHEHIKS